MCFSIRFNKENFDFFIKKYKKNLNKKKNINKKEKTKILLSIK